MPIAEASDCFIVSAKRHGKPYFPRSDMSFLLFVPLSAAPGLFLQIERLEGGLAAACGGDALEDAGLDPQRTRQAIAQLQQKILKLTEQLRIEQAARDENVAEYLKLASNASDKQQSSRIKQARHLLTVIITMCTCKIK